MFIRGELNRITIAGKWNLKLPFLHGKLPALGYDSVLGLMGNSTFSGKPIREWYVKKDTFGQTKQWMRGFPARLSKASSSVGKKGQVFPHYFKSGEISWFHTTFEWNDVPSSHKWNGPLNLRLEGVSSKAAIYLNGRLIGRWLSDSKWMRRGSWAEGLRGPWSNGDEDETPVEPAMLKTGPNLLAILMEDCGTYGSPGVLSKVVLDMSANEEKFTKKNGAGEVLRTYSQKIIVSVQ
jgi:hypothetical protein